MKREAGQAMAEFALVLPMLALLTFGTIEVAIYLQQQSSLNAAAFMAARSASVMGGNTTKTREALRDYADRSPPWLNEAVGSMKARKEGAGFTMTAGADRFSGLISGLTAGSDHPVTGFDTLQAGALLPMEYDPNSYENKPKTGPKSLSLFDYHVKATNKALASTSVSAAKAAAGEVKQKVDEVVGAIGKLKPPTPKPTAQPTARPSSAPRQTPRPTPNVGVTPRPSAMPTPPSLAALKALDGKGEAYSDRGAVMANPKDYSKPNSGGLNSTFYLGPRFEGEGARRMNKDQWNIEVVAKGLAESETNVQTDKGGLKETCDNLNKFLEAARKAHPMAGELVDKFRAGVKKPLTAFEKATTNEYKAANEREKALFRK